MMEPKYYPFIAIAIYAAYAIFSLGYRLGQCRMKKEYDEYIGYRDILGSIKRLGLRIRNRPFPKKPRRGRPSVLNNCPGCGVKEGFLHEGGCPLVDRP